MTEDDTFDALRRPCVEEMKLLLEVDLKRHQCQRNIPASVDWYAHRDGVLFPKHSWTYDEYIMALHDHRK